MTSPARPPDQADDALSVSILQVQWICQAGILPRAQRKRPVYLLTAIFCGLDRIITMACWTFEVRRQTLTLPKYTHRTTGNLLSHRSQPTLPSLFTTCWPRPPHPLTSAGGNLHPSQKLEIFKDHFPSLVSQQSKCPKTKLLSPSTFPTPNEHKTSTPEEQEEGESINPSASLHLSVLITPARMRRTRDAEAELNLPPGFRFHPTDEELVLHYLCRKITHQCLPVPIIAEVNLYKYDPWQLPDRALFGQREWYFFTPRDRKYPNGSRPNRAAGSGYWKATGADKPVAPREASSSKPVGIKKALVFYAGKAPKGAKTNWIMHEYRLADTNHRDAKKKGSLRLDDWVLCRLYNKKNSWEKMQQQQQSEASVVETTESLEAIEESGSDSFRTPESDVDNDTYMDLNGSEKISAFPSRTSDWVEAPTSSSVSSLQTAEPIKEDNDWFMDLNLDDLQNSLTAYGATSNLDLSYQDYYFPGLVSPQLKSSQPPMPQF